MMDNENLYDDTQEQVENQDDTQQEVTEESEVQEQAVEQQPEEQKPAETTQQKNFRLARESAEREKQERIRAERERDEAFAILRDLERRAHEAKASETSPKDDYIDDDAKKLHKEIQQLKAMQERQQKQQYQDYVERKLRKEYPDFDELMTDENIAAFARSNPRRAAILQKEPDLYLQAGETIEGVREMLAKEAPYSQDRAKLAQNAKKPKMGNPTPAQQSSSPLVNLASNGRISASDLDRIREVTQGYINRKSSQ